MTVHRSSRPFGIIFGYQLAGNSLESLKSNIVDFNNKANYCDYFVNLVCVLGVGNIYLEGIRWDLGDKTHLIETDQTVLFFENMRFDENHGIEVSTKYASRVTCEFSNESFGRFLSYTQVILSRMALNVPDVGAYIGTDMPPLIVKRQ